MSGTRPLSDAANYKLFANIRAAGAHTSALTHLLVRTTKQTGLIWIYGLNVRGFNAVNDLSQANTATNTIARPQNDTQFYCSGACKQKAYRLRRKLNVAPVTRDAEDTIVRAPVTRPEHHTENIEVFSTKIDHPQPAIQLSAGRVYSDWKPCPPSDWATLSDLTIPAFLLRETA